MIKLIVSDIDGTLLPYGSEALDDKLFELILRLRQHGEMCIRDRHNI